MKKEISVIIPVYKAPGGFEDLINCLAAQKVSFDYEIIIVDDHSPNEFFKRIRLKIDNLNLPNIHLYQLDGNKGPAAARNFAISKAIGKRFLLVDSDCMLFDSDYLQKVYEKSLRYPNLLMGGTVRGRGNGYVAFCDRFCHWITNIPGYPEGKPPLAHLVTVNLVITREIWNKIGPFDEFLRTGEDTAFCLEARKKNINLMISPHFEISHCDRQYLRDFISCFYQVGKYRAASRSSALDRVPWFLSGPCWRRWLMVPPMTIGLVILQLIKWFPFNKNVVLAIPGITVGMASISVGVAMGVPDKWAYDKNGYNPNEIKSIHQF